MYKPDKVVDFRQLVGMVLVVASVVAANFVAVSSWLDTCPMVQRHNIVACQPEWDPFLHKSRWRREKKSAVTHVKIHPKIDCLRNLEHVCCWHKIPTDVSCRILTWIYDIRCWLLSGGRISRTLLGQVLLWRQR